MNTTSTYRLNSGERHWPPFEAEDDEHALRIAERDAPRGRGREWLQKLARNGGWNWIVPTLPTRGPK